MAPSNLEKAEQARSSVQITLLWLDSKMTAHGAVPMTEPEVDHYLKSASNAEQELMEVYRRIMACSPPDMDPYNAEHITMLDLVSQLSIQLNTIKKAFHPTTRATGGSSSSIADIRLPRLQLPTFDGNLHEWMAFSDIFTTTVHSNPSLSKAQKLTYLKSSLSGEAAGLIRSMTLTDANYDIAWTQLSDRYHNDRELLFSILRRFTSQSTVQTNSSSQVRTLLDTSNECIRSLAVLKLPVDKWDGILLFILFQKLDQTSRELWEQSLTSTSIPPLQGFLDFLEQRARALAAGGNIPGSSGKADGVPPGRRVSHVHHAQESSACCICSNGNHPLYKCSKFISMSPSDRNDGARKARLCFNCLRGGHSVAKCSSSGVCRTCSGKHHTLLHKESSEPKKDPTPLVLNHHSNDDFRIQQTMLATAVVQVRDVHGQQQLCRALLDGGSTSSFITEACRRKLGISWSRSSAEIVGLASSAVGMAKGVSNLTLTSRFAGQPTYTVQALILPKVTSRLPLYPCDPTVWSHLQGLELADPNFHEPDSVDILLGADLFYDLLLNGKKTGPLNSPVALKSTLGWLVAGNIDSTASKVLVHYADVDLDKILLKFWEVEEVSTDRKQTKEEKECQAHFVDNHSVDNTGRFIVRLPLKFPSSNLGSSLEFATRRLKQLERRFTSQPVIHAQYKEFMAEYLQLGHMELIPSEQVMSPCNPTYYIPHHFVLKDSSSTTKLRVVFDASAKTSSGRSLNDLMMVGPTIQDSLVTIIMRFRKHIIAFTADIAKMYRQIRVAHEDADLQRIVWRDDPSKPVNHYRLHTVTYGTAAAPYLATRTLQQLAQSQSQSFPLAHEVVMADFYVDDVMSGTSTEAEGLDTQHQLLQLLATGGMELRKWSSNSLVLLQALSPELRETKELLSIDVDQTVKTLGVYWNPVVDTFGFKLTLDPPLEAAGITKRKLLSEISKIFDPLGWLAPAIIRAKIFMQDLWKLQLGWDEPLPLDILQQWYVYRNNLSHLETISIKRCMMPSEFGHVHLVGYCDASEKAYAAVIYLCVTQPLGDPVISLITSKTRVAPSKQISLPRLELCGAVLLVNLISTVKKSLKMDFTSVTAWTDSTVVLAWLRAHPSRWKTFVANRVTEIQSILDPQSWGHVSGVDNPADAASRGLDPSELPGHPLWWTGPDWLRRLEFPRTTPPPADFPLVSVEEKQAVVCANAITQDRCLLSLCSSLWKLKRITGWIFRFYLNILTRVQARKTLKPTVQPNRGPLTPKELELAFLVWIRLVQQESFTRELHCLDQGGSLPPKSKILSLNPFVDSSDVLRVGGRLRHAQMHPEQRTPILLPRHHRLTQLLIISEHQANLHAGPQLLLATIHRRFWIVGARDAIRHQLKRCVVCTRHRAATMQQWMGDLPGSRVNPGRPFMTCGVDYAGPFLLKPMSPRSKITFKAYLALYVCFTTHAIHLEVVSSLSTQAFLASFRRFIARRGRPTDVHSDCGTNFVGAAKELKEMRALFLSQKHNQQIADDLSKDGMKWHFNPAGAPHFGGLWEAGVKSVKYHLNRVIGTARLTFEELTTTMTQIEACLNSRPLTPVSSDPNDLDALTPGNFLIGAAMTSFPEPDLTQLNTGRLDRWQLVQQLQQHFWQRWSSEFLSRLQQRPKWLQQRTSIQLGDLVLVKDDRFPPLQWKLGRVTKTHPGQDGLTRVVTLKTAEGEIQRPVVKLCLLPIQNPSSSQTADSKDNL